MANFTYKTKQAGYSALGQLSQYDTQQVGVNLTWQLNESNDVRIKLDSREEEGGIDQQSAEVNWLYQFDENWGVDVGIRADETTASTAAQSQNTGQRSDAVIALTYDQKADWQAFVFTQATLKHDENRSANNRVGVGGRYQLNDKFALSGEVSDGNLGFGSQIGGDYQYSDASNLYLNYQLDPDRSDNGLGGRNGQLVGGARHRFSDSVSVYGEERYQYGSSNRSGLTHAYGIDYTPNEHWTFGLAMENGYMQEPGQDKLQRDAIAFHGGYAAQAFKYSGALEYRQDKNSNEKRDSWLLRNNFSYKVNADWRAQLRVDMALSNSSDGEQFNSDFTEALLGFAYRPVENDRLNALVTYNFLEDLAPSEQFTGSGQQNDYQQRSHVTAIDANYDLSQQWTIGGKFARRTGELRQGRDNGEWFSSTAQLYIVRADWHLVKNWDFLVEARLMDVSTAQDKQSGALVALHRHISEHMKIGVGYNFTDFTDDLTDLDYDAKGWFINVIGKW